MTVSTRTASLIHKLEVLDCEIRLAERKGEHRIAGFLQGRAFEMTRGMDEHPKRWHQPCQCDLCNSYGET